MDLAVEISLPLMPCIEWSPALSDKVELLEFNLTERKFPMTDDRLPLAELAAKSGDADLLCALAEGVSVEARRTVVARPVPVTPQACSGSAPPLPGRMPTTRSDYHQCL